ncbi:hypothetical protein BV22DRAFT_1128823 [Leucogyrophana mollusca]|uniref:Uncharacterized protein n=1 Tax=Leucogyrophana mollusca TaxID=85980 RepID=A0ACB8BJG4_9AGAM|nr:hypothetical protein BV22DRAFT_1128823 [Leucogyrophana mollusca]
MKRGFLNRAKEKKRRSRGVAAAASAKSTASSSSSTQPGQNQDRPLQNEKTESGRQPESGDVSYIDPTAIDLHKAPAQIIAELRGRGDDRNRVVFRAWTRDPAGQNIVPLSADEVRGKQTSNGLDLWGATLYDFYRVRRIPDLRTLQTTSTGSRLAAHMRRFGELEWASDEIAWADAEEEPREVFPFDIGKLIQESERGKPGVPLLRQRLPLHLLPKTLVVHDPMNLLHVRRYREESEDHIDQDRVRKYSLCLSKEGEAQAEQSRANAEQEERELVEHMTSDYVYIPPEDFWEIDEGPVSGPVARVIRPPALTGIEEARIYLTPALEDTNKRKTPPTESSDDDGESEPDNTGIRLGTGNHSIVYKAELELPRTLFVKDGEEGVCRLCIAELVSDELRKSDEKEANTEGKKDQSSEPSTSPTSSPDKGKEKEKSSPQRSFPTAKHTRTVWPIVTVSLPPACPHKARVQIAAKLSLEGDPHLLNEAHNYQSFPSHFFEHWNGYNVLEPLHDPVPVGAVVPQFYGYYMPCAEDPASVPGGDEQANPNDMDVDMETEKAESVPYLSPLLLLEQCGTPVDLATLAKDDRTECASLLFRFHHAGWQHGSFAARNILVQNGPLTEWDSVIGKRTSFRMIDFGRSRGVDNGSVPEADFPSGRAMEEHLGLELCRLHHFEV